MGPIFSPFDDKVLKVGCVLAAVAVPLGAWKLVELLWWVWSHLHWESP